MMPGHGDVLRRERERSPAGTWRNAVFLFGSLALVGLSGCGDRVTAPEPATDLEALFSPPSAGEIADVEAEWASRAPDPRGVRVEVDSVVVPGASGTRVRILSHTVDGLRHYGVLVTPTGSEVGPLPVIVFAHGGDDGVSVAEVLLVDSFLGSRGLTVALLAPSFRDEPLRFGAKQFRSDGPSSPWDRDVDDAIALLSAAFETAPALDEDRIAALGFSRGAGVGLLMGARDPRLDAVVEFSGPTDFLGSYARELFREALEGNLGDVPGLDYLDRTVIQPWSAGALATDEARSELLRRSAAHFVERLPAVQVHHGLADTVVAASQAQGLIEEMEAAGRTEPGFESFLYPGSGHDPFSLTGALDRTVEFLARNLEDAPVVATRARWLGRGIRCPSLHDLDRYLAGNPLRVDRVGPSGGDPRRGDGQRPTQTAEDRRPEERPEAGLEELP